MLLLWYFTQNLLCDSWEIRLEVRHTRAIERRPSLHLYWLDPVYEAPLLVGSH